MSKLLVIAAGGTGGHMFPAEALASEMLGRGWRVMLTTDERGMRYAKGFSDRIEKVELKSATFARGGVLSKLSVPWHLTLGGAGARSLFRKDRPAVVAGFGGYPSLPALSAAFWMRIPRIIHEQNGVLGRVNRLFANRVDHVVCGTWPVSNAPDGANLIHLGNPVRAPITALAGQGYEAPGPTGPLNVLTIGGSQGARALSRYVPRALVTLPDAMRKRLDVTHQARAEDLEEAKAVYARGKIKAEVRPFFEDIPERLSRAHLVISRAGASSVAEIAAMARPSILIPYPHAMDDHQRANARALELVGGAVVLPEKGLTRDVLTDHIQAILGNSAQAAAMSENTREVATPDATVDLADLVETLGKPAKG
ncbi:MAG: undecaprenyldiphospho-muramoylpentapeptide beta-N-acetylglucosaminyltransferase [Pseudomonadota bacterium]